MLESWEARRLENGNSKKRVDKKAGKPTRLESWEARKLGNGKVKNRLCLI